VLDPAKLKALLRETIARLGARPLPPRHGGARRAARDPRRAAAGRLPGPGGGAGGLPGRASSRPPV